MRPVMRNTAETPPGNGTSRTSFVRQAIEFFVCLAVAVTLFRAFAAEGYMIKTGSMAPCLLGYHRKAVCPVCRFPFAVDEGPEEAPAACPNCGQSGIGVKELPHNDGDQLLVARAAYEYQPPQRWEVVVFRNPSRPTQAYVKRIAALPGETVQIIRGDVYVAGKIQMKSLDTQRGVRIAVDDLRYHPPDDDPEWQPRWLIDVRPPQPVHTGVAPSWERQKDVFVFDGIEGANEESSEAIPLSQQTAHAVSAADELPLAWVRYRHWIRRGGNHATSVTLAEWPETLALQSGDPLLQYDGSTQTLVCRGAMPRVQRDRLLAEISDEESRHAIAQLYEASHVAPITDVYGYNRARGMNGEHEVRDLLVCFELEINEGKGEFAIGLTDGTDDFECRIDLQERQIRLLDVRTGKTLRSGALRAGLFPGRALIEFSIMDRQALMAIDGTLPFEPWPFAEPHERGPTPWQPARFGARQLRARVTELKLFRDVYYTSGEGHRGFDAPLTLGPEEYFVLGDNSPVSRDSRSWPSGKVLTSGMLLGKPFLVHLPSRQERVKLGRWQMDIRIPEFSEMRYIR